MGEKKRLDVMIFEKGMFPTRNRARSEIMSGRVLVDGKVSDKPGTLVKSDAEISLLPGKNPYVSRGGLKIEGAYEDLNIVFQGKTVMDAGASTGGFTDFALQHGARKVYAIDVGYGQLDWKLRRDERVINMERFNIRYLKREDIQETIDMALADVSFISLKKVIPVFAALEIPEMLLLVKPQFEAGREKVGKNGVVRDPEVHNEVLSDITAFAEKEGYILKGMAPSRLKGPRGNTEFFIYMEKKCQLLRSYESEFRSQNINSSLKA